ncbi:MAG: hypothetical protein ROW48_15060 [Bellilinea sp.]|jgi:hydrogenase maturation protease
MPDPTPKWKQQVPAPEHEQEPALFQKTLLFGYGNIDRQDDGVAWHILRKTASHLGFDLPAMPQEHLVELTPQLSIAFFLHLVPEHSELISQFERVVFIDAHTGNIEKEIRFSLVQPGYEPSPFTHHLTPATCLALAYTLYHRAPQAMLLSVRGYSFGFSQLLSDNTAALVPPAAGHILTWIG